MKKSLAHNLPEAEFNRAMGTTLKMARREKELTQAQLGKQLGITFQQVQKYEAGKNNVTAHKLALIEHALQLPAGGLIERVWPMLPDRLQQARRVA